VARRNGRPRGLSHGNLRPKGRGFEYRFFLNGKSYSFSIRAETLAQAVSRANEIYAQEERRAGLAATGVPVDWRFRDLLEYLRERVFPSLKDSTRATYELTGRLFCAFAEKELGDPLLQDYQGFHIQRYLDWRKSAKQLRWGEKNGARDRLVSKRTLQKDRTILHSLFQRAVDLEIREGNPVAKTKPVKAARRIPCLPSPDRVEALIEEMRGPMARLYAMTLAETAGRCESEILRLRWEDLDFEKGFLRVYATKTNKERKIPMSRRLAQAYKEHVLRYRDAKYGGKHTEWVFHHLKNQRHARAGDRIKSMRRAIQGAAKRAGITGDFHVHDLRHWRITKWLAEGKPLAAVQKAVGHSDPRTTSFYTHLDDSDLLVLVDRDK